MDKRIKNKLCLTTFFVFLCLLFVPNHPVYASFSDSASEDAGISLTLGTVDLLAEKDESNETAPSYTLKSENNKVDINRLVKNNGTLSGKLAYKISLTKADGTSINNELLQSVKLKLNGSEAIINNQYNLVSNVDGTSLILTPSDSKDISIQMEVTDFPKQNEEIKIQIEFLLFQTNGTTEKPLFHDKETISYTFKIEKEQVIIPPEEDGEVVIPPKDEDNSEYWPTKGWIDKGNIQYNLEDYSPIMYFSEIADDTKIKNLNDIIVYIEVKDPEGVDLYELDIHSTNDMSIEVQHVNENKRQLKVTISINENSFKQKSFSVPVYDYSIAANSINKPFDFEGVDAPITLKRVLLSTDDANNPEGRDRVPRPINLFGEERKIYLAQSNQNEHNNLSIPLEKISFDNNVKTSINAQGKNNHSIQIGKDTAEEALFTLKPVTPVTTTISDLQLSILLEGNSGETLEVKREVQLLPTNSEVSWPEKIDGYWVTQDLESNFTTSQASAKLVKNKGKYNSENMFIYIKNPDKEALQFSLTNPTTFPVQRIEYSPSGDYMRVVFKYKGSNPTIPTHSNSIVSDFTFTVNREIGGGLIYGQYLKVELFP